MLGSRANLGAYAAWAQANNSLLIITFDENATPIPPSPGHPDHIATIVVGAGDPSGRHEQLAGRHPIPCSTPSKAFMA